MNELCSLSFYILSMLHTVAEPELKKLSGIKTIGLLAHKYLFKCYFCILYYF